jgi:hypothetical protein
MYPRLALNYDLASTILVVALQLCTTMPGIVLALVFGFLIYFGLIFVYSMIFVYSPMFACRHLVFTHLHVDIQLLHHHY